MCHVCHACDVQRVVEHAIRSSKGQGLAPGPATPLHAAEGGPGLSGASAVLNHKADFLLEVKPSPTCANLFDRLSCRPLADTRTTLPNERYQLLFLATIQPFPATTTNCFNLHLQLPCLTLTLPYRALTISYPALPYSRCRCRM